MNASSFVSSATSKFPLDPVKLLRKPKLVVKIISIISAIIVFGAISSCHKVKCMFDDKEYACNFGVGVGVLAFLGLVFFLILDFKFEKISNVKTRRHLLLGEVGFCGLWTFMWFLLFCILANLWHNTTEKFINVNSLTYCKDNARSSIFFSFLSIGIFGGLTFFSLQRFRLGTDSNFEGIDGMSDPDPNMMNADETTAAPYSANGYNDEPNYGDPFGKPVQNPY